MILNPLAKALAIAVAALLIICGLGYFWIQRQGVHIDQLEAHLGAAQGANGESTKTIAALTIERDKNAETCESRLAGYNATLTELQRIDGLQGGNDAHRETMSENSGPINGDPLLTALNRMYPAGGQDGVCQTGNPGSAGGSAILPGSVRYCFCSDDDVRNFLKNQALMAGRESELVSIFDGLR